MWKLVYLRGLIESSSAIPDAELDSMADRRDKFDDACRQILSSKDSSDTLKIEIAKTTCEMYTSFSALRNVKRAKPGAPEEGAEEDDTYTALILDIPGPSQTLLLQTLGIAEKTFAKLTRRNLEAADDDDPLDLDDDEDDDPETQTFDDDQEKLRATILAERRLCELTGALIRAVLAGVVDKTAMTKRLNRNKARLGKNYADCVAYLDIGRTGKKPGTKGAAAAAKKALTASKASAKGRKAAKSKEIVDMADEMEDEDPIEDEDERLIEEDQQRAEGDGDEEMGDAMEDGDRDRESVLGD